MRGIYALTVSLLLVLLFLLTFIAARRVFERQTATFSDYLSAVRHTYLLHDVDYTLRQALYFALEDSVASGDPAVVLSSARSWVAKWAVAWASKGVSVDVNLDLLSVAFNPEGTVSLSYPTDLNVYLGGKQYVLSGVSVAWSGG